MTETITTPLRLTEAERDYLKTIGEGNMAEGLRRLIDISKKQTPPEVDFLIREAKLKLEREIRELIDKGAATKK